MGRKTRPHTVIPAQAGTQWSAKRDQNNDSYQVPTRPVMPAQAGIQRGDEGAEGTDSACILVFPQVGLVVRDDYNLCASFMFIWVPAFAGMTGKGVIRKCSIGRNRQISSRVHSYRDTDDRMHLHICLIFKICVHRRNLRITVGVSLLARPPGCGVRGCRCPGVAARWPYPALRRFNRSAIGNA